MATFNVQKRHSRNGHDWSLETDSTGRHSFNAEGKGLKYRIGMVFAHIARQGGVLSSEKLTVYLQKLHPSYQPSDLAQVRNQLAKAGCIKVQGRGKDAVWSITPKGQSIMAKATYKWV